MISRNLVSPRPSHPRSSVIRFGKNTNIFIDRTNSATTMLKRVTCLSCLMYEEENIKTFDAMNSTVRDVISPIGSRMIGNEISELLIVMISQ